MSDDDRALSYIKVFALFGRTVIVAFKFDNLFEPLIPKLLISLAFNSSNACSKSVTHFIFWLELKVIVPDQYNSNEYSAAYFLSNWNSSFLVIFLKLCLYSFYLTCLFLLILSISPSSNWISSQSINDTHPKNSMSQPPCALILKNIKGATDN